MLQEAQRTWAPRAISVSINTAVWMVMCKEPEMRAPLSGCCLAYSYRMAMRPGISVSAILISLRPQSARLKSLTRKLDWGLIAAFIRLLRSSIHWKLGPFLGSAGTFQFGRKHIRFVGALPAELFFLAAEMTVSGGFLVNRAG